MRASLALPYYGSQDLSQSADPYPVLFLLIATALIAVIALIVRRISTESGYFASDFAENNQSSAVRITVHQKETATIMLK